MKHVLWVLTRSALLYASKKKSSDYHQITHLVCFSVFIINFADIKSNFRLSDPTCKGGQNPQKFLMLISLESLGCYAIQNVSLREVGVGDGEKGCGAWYSWLISSHVVQG